MACLLGVWRGNLTKEGWAMELNHRWAVSVKRWNIGSACEIEVTI